MDNFGTDYRKVVDDTVGGNIQRESSAAKTTSIAMAGRSTEVLDPEKRTTAKALIDIASTIGTQIGTRKQTEDYNNAFTNATQEGLDAMQETQSFWNKYVFGPSASMRGAQDAIIDRETNDNYITNLKTTERDYKDYDTAGYKKKLDSQLQAALEKQKDPEMRKRIVESFTKNAAQLGRMHAQGRQVWEAVVHRTAIKNKVVGAGDLLNQAYQSKDPKVKAEAEAGARAALTNCEGMHAVPCQDTRVQAIIEDLQNHDNPQLMGFAEKEGYLKNLTPLNQQRIRDARAVYETENSIKYANDMQELKIAIADQDGTAEVKIQAAKARYGVAFNVNQWREANGVAAEKLRQEKIVEQKNAYDLLTMSPERFNQTTAELTKSFQTNMQSLASAGIAADRREQIRKAQETGEKLTFDPNKTPTEAEENQWLMNNPIKAAAQWKNAQVHYPQLQQQVGQMTALLRSPALLPEQLNMLKPMMDNINVFKNTDPELFASTFKGDQDTLDLFNTYDVMINQEGMLPRTAIERIREQQKLPRPDLADLQQDYLEDGIDDALALWQDKAGDKYVPWLFGGFEDDFENEDYAREAMRGYFQESWQAHKGDMKQAVHGAYQRMLKHGTVAGGKFIIDGASLNTNIASADTLLRGWDNNKDFKSGPRWQGAGFGAGESIFDDDKVIRKGINGEIVITGHSTRTGQLISTSIEPARDKRDLAPTDLSTVQSYGTHIRHTIARSIGLTQSGADLEKPSEEVPAGRPPTPTSIPDALWQIGEHIYNQ